MATQHILRTKIVCTLGPATSSLDAIRGLIQAGMNVARINFSHGTAAEHEETIKLVRAAAESLGLPVAILGDLQGPRIRIGDLRQTVVLKQGDDIVLVHEGEEAPDEFPVTYENLSTDVHVGDRILVDDGLIELVVLEIDGIRVRARVIHGGELRSHKGLNLPGIHVSAPSITAKDAMDIDFAIAHDLDYLALSFVRRAEDIESLRVRMPGHVLIVAKIEKDVALNNIESIIRAADAVMVARGDLGVELPYEEVPMAQKRIIALANRIGRPVITATQMLESMIEHPRPTRAEASDVANAILDGTDAVMLSAETAAGAYPRLAAEAMRRIITETEKHPQPGRGREGPLTFEGVVPTELAIAAATVVAVQPLATPLVVVFTKGGFSARVVASYRPGVPILALTDQPRTYRQLALVWGVVPELVPHCDTYDHMMEVAREVVIRRHLASEGDRLVVTAGVPFDVPGTTNLLKVESVKLTFLGTGTSFGVPQVGCHCAVCRSSDPRDRRTRVGAVIETESGTRLLVDTPPELRMQLIAAGIDRVDAVLFTHDHADHTHGLDDIRAITVRRDGPLTMYGPADSLDRLARRFSYIFDAGVRAVPGTSKPEGVARALTPGETVTIGDVDVTPIALPHGPATVFAYRVGDLGYITDAQIIPDAAIEAFRGVKVLVLNALFRTEHPTHLSLPEAVRAARAIGAERTYLTHLTHDNLHADLEAELPRGISPAFDGLTVRVD